MSNKKIYLELALKEAMIGIKKSDGAPFGACIVTNDQLIAIAHDTVLKDCDATSHAEINAIRMGSKYLKSYRLDSSAIYCTSEPCPMCLAAIHFAGIESCYFIADRNMAATYGFDDSLLYDELSKPIFERKMHIVQQLELQTGVDKLFKQWEKKGLPIC